MMNASKKRVLDALTGKTPDKIPYIHSLIAQNVREGILGHPLDYGEDYFDAPDYGPVCKPGEETFLPALDVIDPRVARKIGLDAVCMGFFPPNFANTTVTGGLVFMTDGLLTSKEAIDKITFPDPDDEKALARARRYVQANTGEFAVGARIRLGISFILNSMGLEHFSYMLADSPELIVECLEKYAAWNIRLIRNLNELGFDFMWAFDDLAYSNMPMFSTEIFEEIFFPTVKKMADEIATPWIFHSDGNLMPILDSLKKLGMNGIHPLEPGTMDLAELKAKHGKDLTLIGNIDINHLLTDATREEVFAAVKDRVEVLGPGGRYIISDSNSVPSYCTARNVMYLAEAVREYRNFY